MKTVLLFLLLSLSLPTVAQKSMDEVMPVVDGTVKYTGVVQVDGAKATDLMGRAKRWAVTAYRSAKDVVQLSDDATGTMIVKGLLVTPWAFNGMMKTQGSLRHALTIEVKDGRYRYTFTDMMVVIYNAPSQYTRGGTSELTMEQFEAVYVKKGIAKKSNVRYLIEANERIKLMLADLQKAMATGASDF